MTGRLALVLLLPLLAAGCIRGTLPARELYRLTPPDSAFRGGASPLDTAPGRGGGGGDVVRPTLDGTLGIMPYETPGLYGETGIVYRVGEAEYGVYPSREWALPLGDMLGLMTARLAAGSTLTRELPLFDPPSPRSQAYLWRATVREFEEVNRGRQLLVAVRIDATLVRARDDSVLWTGSSGYERPVTAGQDMTAIVRALSGTAATIVRELLSRAERDLGRGGAANPAAPPTQRPAPPASDLPAAPLEAPPAATAARRP